MAEAMFGAGCFWGIETAFRRLKGVSDAAVGYAGGQKDEPSYEEVCTGTTGHAEVVHVTFNPKTVSYESLLEAFWLMHDPTQMNRQGPDHGTQYRSAIFTYDDAQKEAAEKSKAARTEDGRHGGPNSRPIATEITPAGTFWRAEDYHQRYDEKRAAASARMFGGWKR